MADNRCLLLTDVHMWVEHVNDIVFRRNARAALRSRKKVTQGKRYLYSLYSDEGITSETSASILSFLRCRIYIFITKLFMFINVVILAGA